MKKESWTNLVLKDRETGKSLPSKFKVDSDCEIGKLVADIGIDLEDCTFIIEYSLENEMVKAIHTVNCIYKDGNLVFRLSQTEGD